MQLTTRTLAILTILFFASTAAANEKALVELHELLSETRSLQGDFNQLTRDEQGQVVEENTGTFAIKRPGLLRWHIEKPFEQLLVSDGESLWVYDPDLEQVTINTVDEQMQRNSALLLSSDLEKIRDNYRVEEVREENDRRVFVLVPLNDGAFEKLELTFDSQGQVNSWRLHTELGEESSFSFRNLQINQMIPDSHFVFDPPPGVDVLDER